MSAHVPKFESQILGTYVNQPDVFSCLQNWKLLKLIKLQKCCISNLTQIFGVKSVNWVIFIRKSQNWDTIGVKINPGTWHFTRWLWLNSKIFSLDHTPSPPPPKKITFLQKHVRDNCPRIEIIPGVTINRRAKNFTILHFSQYCQSLQRTVIQMLFFMVLYVQEVLSIFR